MQGRHMLCNVTSGGCITACVVCRSEVESSAGSTLQPTQASTSRLATDGDDSTRLAGSDVSQASLAAGSEEGAPSSLLAPPREPPSVSDAQEQQV